MLELLEKIEAHLAESGESASAFGERALGDRKFVFDLRNKKRRCWPETVARVEEELAKPFPPSPQDNAA